MKVLRSLAAVTLVFAVLFTVFFGRYKIVESGVNTDRTEYKGVLTLWQIDSFEGGSGSRKQFLLKAARGFERKNSGVLIMVINQTADGAKACFDKGEYPDLISFGCGVDVSKYTKITPTKKVLGGLIGNDCYATAWCKGGYVLIFNKDLVDENSLNGSEIDELLVSQGEFIQPLAALCFENITAKSIETLKPFDAYVKFTSGKVKYFLGTQRDIVRLNNRGMEYNALPLEKFCDLYQYISVTSTDALKNYYANLFVEYLVSDEVQKHLNDISMFSPFINVDYDSDALNKMQNAKTSVTISAFTNKAQLEEIKRLSALYIGGEKSMLNKIKNMCVIS